MGEVAKAPQEQALVDAAKRDLVSAEASDRQVVAEDTGRRATLRGHFVGALPADSAASSRWVHLVVFLLVVVLPTLFAGIYYGFVASDQYVTDIRFGVRSADPERNDASGMIQGSQTASASQIVLQSNVVVEYMKSREIVEAVDKDLDLRKIFSLPSVDYFSRLDPNAPIERSRELLAGQGRAVLRPDDRHRQRPGARLHACRMRCTSAMTSSAGRKSWRTSCHDVHGRTMLSSLRIRSTRRAPS